MRFRIASLPLLAVLVALPTGCATKILPPSGPHAAVSVDSVAVLQEQPPTYELLGVVTTPITEGPIWDDRGDAAPAFEELKAQAARMGATAILMKAPPGEYDFVLTAGYKNFYYQIPVKAKPRIAVVEAIFVVK